MTMILYPYIETFIEPIPFVRLGVYEGRYESEYEIPTDSPKHEVVKDDRAWVFRFYAGFKDFQIPFPSYELFRSYVDVIDSGFFGGSAEFRLLKDVFGSLQRYGVLSNDYECRSNSACGNRRYVDEDAITPLIVEWIGNQRYHFMTIEQFCSIDFNNYFDTVSREDHHYIDNIEYLRKLVFRNKSTYRDRNGNIMSEVVVRHQREKVEHLLRTNPVGFAIDHFKKYIKSASKSNYSQY